MGNMSFCSENECFKHFCHSVAQTHECLKFPLCHSSPLIQHRGDSQGKYKVSLNKEMQMDRVSSCYKLKQLGQQCLTGETPTIPC